MVVHTIDRVILAGVFLAPIRLYDQSYNRIEASKQHNRTISRVVV